MQVILNTARAYGGSIGGPVAIWTVICLLFCAATLFGYFKRRSSTQAGWIVLLCGALWLVHVAVWYYTTLQIAAWICFNSSHLTYSEKNNNFFLLIQGCAAMAAISTGAMVVGTLLLVAPRHPSKAPPN